MDLLPFPFGVLSRFGKSRDLGRLNKDIFSWSEVVNRSRNPRQHEQGEEGEGGEG